MNQPLIKELSYTDRGSSFDSSYKLELADNYDFCMVLPVDETTGELAVKGRGCVRTLKKLGFELFSYPSKYPDCKGAIFVLIRTPLERLKDFAEENNFKMKLDPIRIKAKLAEGDKEHNIEGVNIAHLPDISHLDPHEYIYGRYTRAADPSIEQSIYFHEPGADNPFREIVRLKIGTILLQSSPSKGENLKIERYLRFNHVLAFFALHNREKTRDLEVMWSQFPWKPLPLYHMKEYFGEKITMYLAFLEHFMAFLLAPAIVGLPMQIYVIAASDYSAVFLPFFSFFIAMWSVTMLEFWKRKESFLALKWGAVGFEDNEVQRPDFRGKKIDSFIDGSMIEFYEDHDFRHICIGLSYITIALLISLVIGVVVAIYVLRFALAPSIGNSNAQTVASILNAVQIQVLNYFYLWIVTELSERENHRTETEFEDSMITKVFLFQFVNSYASFFYLAFVADLLGDCPAGDCMPVLAINLAIIYGTRMFLGILLGVVIPYFYSYQMVLKVQSADISRPEKEYFLERYNQLSSTIQSYSDIAITFGYMAMFVTALPGAALLALIYALLEINTDSWKLLRGHQRPLPTGCEDIGSWQTIFLIISVIAVVTNAGLTTYTMTTLDGFSMEFKFWVFILFQWICFMLQAAIMAAIPDVPDYVTIQTKRTEFIESKLIEKDADFAIKEFDITSLDEPLLLSTYP